MYIANQSFKDEETLLEQLFDFSLGDESDEIKELKARIEKELKENDAFQQYRKGLSDEEDIMELDEDERRIRLAEYLMDRYDSFKVEQKQLFGIKNGVSGLLFDMRIFE